MGYWDRAQSDKCTYCHFNMTGPFNAPFFIFSSVSPDALPLHILSLVWISPQIHFQHYGPSGLNILSGVKSQFACSLLRGSLFLVFVTVIFDCSVCVSIFCLRLSIFSYLTWQDLWSDNHTEINILHQLVWLSDLCLIPDSLTICQSGLCLFIFLVMASSVSALQRFMTRYP